MGHPVTGNRIPRYFLRADAALFGTIPVVAEAVDPGYKCRTAHLSLGPFPSEAASFQVDGDVGRREANEWR